MQFIAMPRGRHLADLSALTIAFLICLAVIVFSWPEAMDETAARQALCCEVQTAELDSMPAAAGMPSTAQPQRSKR